VSLAAYKNINLFATRNYRYLVHKRSSVDSILWQINPVNKLTFLILSRLISILSSQHALPSQVSP